MNLVILTQYYPPEIGAPQARLSELAAYFVSRGHSVTVLTAMPNYPTGKIHASYGGVLRREQRDGVKILRTFIYPTQKADLIRRLSNYFSFVFSSSIFGSIMLEEADYLLVESPPLFLGLAGLWLSRLKKARLIFNVSDLWPESAVRLGVVNTDSSAYKMSEWLEGLCYRKAWLVTGQSKGILDHINGRYPQCKTFHLSNGVDTDRFRPMLKSNGVQPGLICSTNFTGLYAGLHGLAQGLDQILDAAKLLRHEPECNIVFVGEGPEKIALKEQAMRERLPNVHFLDGRPAADMPALVANADVILVTLKTYIPGAVPSKLYEAMASGRPIILVANGEAAKIVQDHNAGIVIEPGDIKGLAQALRLLRSKPEVCCTLGENGRRAAVQHFDRQKILSRFLDHLESNIER